MDSNRHMEAIMKIVPLLSAAALLALGGCAIVPAEPGYPYAYAAPPVAATVVIRPAYPAYRYHGYYGRRGRWR